MKKIFTPILATLILTLVLSLNLSAQLFFKAGVGFGAGTQPLIIGEAYTTSEKENIYASFGGNLGFYIGAGLQLNDFMDVEVDLGYQNGRSESVIDPFSSRTYVGKLIYLSPSLVFRTSVNDDLSPYAKLGFTTGLPLTKVLVGSEEHKFRGGFPFGYIGAVGVDYNISRNVKVFGEIYHQSLIYKPKKRREFDGTVYKFKDKIAYPEPDKTELVHHIFSYGALGLNIGLKLIF